MGMQGSSDAVAHILLFLPLSPLRVAKETEGEEEGNRDAARTDEDYHAERNASRLLLLQRPASLPVVPV